MTNRPPLRIWPWWIIVGIIALGLRMYVTPVAYLPDECVYVQHAWNLSHGRLDLSDSSWYVHRIPVYLPSAVLYSLFGLSHLCTVAWPMAASLLQIFLGMALALRIAGSAASVLCGLLLAFLPLDVLASVHLLPDGPFAALMSLSVFLWWIAQDVPSTATRRSLLLSAGLSLALAALMRPYAGILFVLFILDAFLGRQAPHRLVPVIVGAGATVIFYLTVYLLAVGDPLYRLRIVADTYGSGFLAEPARLSYYPRALLDPRGPFALHGLLLLASIPVVLRRLVPSHIRLLAWISILLAFLQFGSMSLDTYVPILKRARFLSPISLPLCLIISIAASRWVGPGLVSLYRIRPLSGSTLGAYMVLAAMAGSFVLSLGHLSTTITEERPRFRAYSQAASLIGSRSDLAVYVDDWRTAIQLGPYVEFFGGRGFYLGRDDEKRMSPGHFDPAGRLRYAPPEAAISDLTPCLILIDRENDLLLERSPSRVGLGNRIDDAPSDSRTLLFARAGVELYELSRNGRGRR